VLDTHVWVWWLAGRDDLLRTSWSALLAGSTELGVSAISCFEVAWLVKRQRIEISLPLEEWFDAALGGTGIRLLELSPKVAQIAANLSEHHLDPQDRIIIATAIAYDAELMSADGRFRSYPELEGRLIS
jgi:PIN domain nuclease of toxin-antitoxin system